MERKPLLSIIIPIFNAERYLEKTIKSIINQTFAEWELLLINDGSTDSSELICKRYIVDSRVHYYKMENGGPLRARCYGAKRAEGEYILFCDADDYYLNKNCLNKLQVIVNSNPVDLIQFGNIKKYRWVRKKENSVNYKEMTERDVYYERDYPKLLCSFWEKSELTLCVWNKAYHRNLIDSLPDIEEFDHVFMGDDLIFNLHTLQNCKTVLYIPDILYCYRSIAGYSKMWNKKTMYDLDKIKSYQRQFLNAYIGEDKDSIEAAMYSEVAGWFLVHIIEGISIDEEDMIQYITEVLDLPQFQRAKEYYIRNSSIHYPAVDLLRKGDSKSYIDYAYEQVNKNRFRRRIKGFIRKMI